MANNKKKVVIVDDHPLFRERLAQLINLQPDMEVTGEAESSEDAIPLIQKPAPDLTIVDISLKGSSGPELIKHIKALSIGLPALVLSMHDETLYAERALRAGASGYITKHQTADKVLSAMRRVLWGRYLSFRDDDFGILEEPNGHRTWECSPTSRLFDGSGIGSAGIDRTRRHDSSDS